MGPTRASLLDLLAWQLLAGQPLRQWERGAIMALGAAWIAAQHEPPAVSTAPPANGVRTR